ncbi:phage integrase family protein [Paraburkholderia sp. BL8N3]|nr:tyrosine-type recombinase/integrase [Paraburkholderia sp. BL8N3]TCK31944.1 phage integrase family protein [Paraburkholderia sp. BL8N3]
MPKPQILEAHQFSHALKVAGITGQNTTRDVALLLVFYGTGLTANEVAKLLVSDYLAPSGEICRETTLRADIAFNSKPRPLVWTSGKVCTALDAYLAHRVAARQSISTARSAYRGLDANSPLFVAGDGQPFTFTRRVTPSGAVSYSCESLTEIVRRLHQQAGIEHGNASSARRTFAVRLHRQGRSLKLIQELIGVSSLTAVKRLIDGDPVRMASIMSGVL